MVVGAAGDFLSRRRPPARSTPRTRRALLPFALALLAACAQPSLDWQGRPTPSLDAYQQSFERAVGDAFVATTTLDALLRELRTARVLWLGDHHRDPLLHAAQRDLLLQLQRRGVDVALGLEAIGSEDQGAVADYLAHRVEFDDLARGIRARWPGSWLDADEVDAPHYRALLRLCDGADWPAFALEPTPRLRLGQRDAVIAAAVRTAAARHPDRLLVIVVGQAHLLGDGDLIARCGLPSVALGARAPRALAVTAPRRVPPGALLRSSGGLWFFADLLPPR